MASWRDETPEAVQRDLDALADRSFDAAQHLLAKNVECIPFGVALDVSGQERIITAMPEASDGPDTSEAILNSLYTALLLQRDGFRAAAVVSDVLVAGSDAIRVQMEHREGGPAMNLLLPYSKKLFRRFTYGDVTGSRASRRVWPNT